MLNISNATKIYTDTELLENISKLYKGIVIEPGDIQILANVLDLDFNYLMGYLKVQCPDNNYFKR